MTEDERRATIHRAVDALRALAREIERPEPVSTGQAFHIAEQMRRIADDLQRAVAAADA